jgi:hypothetical protein
MGTCVNRSSDRNLEVRSLDTQGRTGKRRPWYETIGTLSRLNEANTSRCLEAHASSVTGVAASNSASGPALSCAT